MTGKRSGGCVGTPKWKGVQSSRRDTEKVAEGLTGASHDL